jgi:hypothetical protein
MFPKVIQTSGTIGGEKRHPRAFCVTVFGRPLSDVSVEAFRFRTIGAKAGDRHGVSFPCKCGRVGREFVLLRDLALGAILCAQPRKQQS